MTTIEFLKYNKLLFFRTHGYIFPLVMTLYLSIIFLIKPPSDEIKVWVLIGFLDLNTSLVLLAYGANLLGSERAFWSLRVCSKTPIISVIFERLIALMAPKIVLSFSIIFFYGAIKRIAIPIDFYLCLFFLNLSLLPWVAVLSSILNPQPCKPYLLATDFQTTSTVNMLYLCIMLLVIVLVYAIQVWLRYVLRETVEIWILGSVVLSIILFSLFPTVGIRLFSNLLYKYRFSIAQKLRPTT